VRPCSYLATSGDGQEDHSTQAQGRGRVHPYLSPDHKHHNPDGYLEFAATVPERVAVGDAVHVRIDYVPASG
jgi:hypothetical protein